MDWARKSTTCCKFDEQFGVFEGLWEIGQMDKAIIMVKLDIE